METRGSKCNTTSINVNNLLEQCTDSSNGNQSHPLYHLTKITKLLQYNIDSLHESKYLVAPKLLLFYYFSISSLLKKKKHVYQNYVFAFTHKKYEGRSSNQVWRLNESTGVLWLDIRSYWWVLYKVQILIPVKLNIEIQKMVYFHTLVSCHLFSCFTLRHECFRSECLP